MVGRVLSLDTRVKMGAAQMGRKHSLETKAKMSATRLGRKFSEEHKASISRARKGNPNWQISIEGRGRIALASARRLIEHGFPWLPTSLEYALQLLLEDAGLEFEAQKRFGRYIVDVYVPELNLAFEADGQFWHWHKNKKREAKRNESLLQSGVAAVIHLDDEDLDPWCIK